MRKMKLISRGVVFAEKITDYLQNIKMLCRNNLIMVGKWGGASFMLGTIITAFIFGGNILSSHAYVIDTTTPASFSKPADFKLDLDSIGKINEVTLPINNLINDTLKGLRFNQNMNIGTGIPVSPIKNSFKNIDFNKFFSLSKVSSNDVTGFLKGAATTGINLTILVISITSQVLKGLLSVLK